MTKILAATNNEGKLNEIRGILGPLGIDVVTPAEVGGLPSIPETGKTFADNAKLKAMAAAGMKQMPALADDSGLEVFALNGAPGVLSARYAGAQATDADRMSKLLGELGDQADRAARFVCVVALATPRGVIGTAEGEVRGTIAAAPAGDGGFGYDPLFVPDGETLTFGQIPPLEKHAMSHRGNALRNAVAAGLFSKLPRQALFEDRFTAAPAGDWRWLREQRDGWWILDGALQIKALPGTLWQDQNNARNVLMRPAPDGAFSVEVMVTNGPTVNAEQAGLVYYVDDDNYIKVVKEFLNDEVWIVMAREAGGKFSVVNKVAAQTATATLRFEIHGDTIMGSFKHTPDGEYLEVGACAIGLPGTPGIGILAHGAADDASARRAQFRQFQMFEL